MPYAAPPPVSTCIKTRITQVKGTPTIVDTKFETNAVFTDSALVNLKLFLRYIASIAIIGSKEIEYTGTASIIIGSPAFAEAPNEIKASGNKNR